MAALNARKVFRIFRLLGRLTCTWPADFEAGKSATSVWDVAWAFSLLNVTGLLAPLMLATYHFRHDVTTMMKSLSELTALTEVFCNLILCRMKRAELQVEMFARVASPEEEEVLEKYIGRYAFFSTFVGASYALAAVAFSAGPILLSTSLPADAWYPFPVGDSTHLGALLYSQQVFVILQTGLSIAVDYTVAMLFWYPAARLEMLGMELDRADPDAVVPLAVRLGHVVRKHRQIISFVEEVQRVVGRLLFKTNMTMTAAVICGAFPLIHHQPLPVVSQFICMVIGGCARLYITAWPADDLREMSQEMASAAYNTEWMDASAGTRRSVLIMMRRAQKPLVIAMGGLLPSLSLSYYASFLYGTSSYFMTMRAVIDK